MKSAPGLRARHESALALVRGVIKRPISFITRFGEALKAATIAVAHILTGFVEGVPTLAGQQAANPTGWRLVIFGIRVHTAIVPALLVLAMTIVFWLRFDLTPEKTAANRKKLEEMGI